MVFWIVLALVGFAVLMLKLGAMSVWVKLLSFALIVVACAVALGAAVFLWRRLVRRA